MPRDIGVHELTEFVFCPRAGIHAVEYPEQANPVLQAQRLDYSPDYELGILWDALLRRLRSILTITIGGVFGICITTFSEHSSRFMFQATIVCLCWFFLKPTLRELPSLCQTIQKARTAEPAEPNLDNRAIEQIGWWQLIAAGYEIIKLDPIRNDKLKIATRIWRVMRRGNTMIPVFHRRSKNSGEPLFQHEIRIAAYCYLLRANGFESPFGVILDHGTEMCWIIKDNAKRQQQLVSEILRARAMIDSAAQGEEIPEPRNATACRGCHWGEPKKEAATKYIILSGGEAQPSTIWRNGEKIRSICGDRFTWFPPFERDHESAS